MNRDNLEICSREAFNALSDDEKFSLVTILESIIELSTLLMNPTQRHRMQATLGKLIYGDEYEPPNDFIDSELEREHDV